MENKEIKIYEYCRAKFELDKLNKIDIKLPENYFSLDVDISCNEINLITKCNENNKNGYEYYFFYIELLRYLAKQTNTNTICKLKDLNVISYFTKINVDVLKELICNYDLFQYDNEFFYNEKVYSNYVLKRRNYLSKKLGGLTKYIKDIDLNEYFNNISAVHSAEYITQPEQVKSIQVKLSQVNSSQIKTSNISNTNEICENVNFSHNNQNDSCNENNYTMQVLSINVKKFISYWFATNFEINLDSNPEKSQIERFVNTFNLLQGQYLDKQLLKFSQNWFFDKQGAPGGGVDCVDFYEILMQYFNENELTKNQKNEILELCSERANYE